MPYTTPPPSAATPNYHHYHHSPGVSPGIPLHEAWSLLLDGFMPLMAQEAGTMADLLLMYRYRRGRGGGG